MMRVEAVGFSVVFLVIFLFDLRIVVFFLVIREYFWISEIWVFGEDGVIRLRRIDFEFIRAFVGVEKLFGKMGFSIRFCYGEVGESGESCGFGEVRVILSLEVDRFVSIFRFLGFCGVVIREFIVIDFSFSVFDFSGVDFLFVITVTWEVGVVVGVGVGDGVRD